jgi:hypothetical protein
MLAVVEVEHLLALQEQVELEEVEQGELLVLLMALLELLI